MNEIISGYLIELMETLKTGANFLIGELPAFANEIIVWGIASNCLWALTIWLFVVILFYIARTGKKSAFDKYKDNPRGVQPDDDDVEWWVWTLGTFFGWVMVIVSTAVSIYSLFTIFKAIFAPRLYLIEAISKMVAGN